MIAWSYGGGFQSVAIGVLIREGRLPVPDLAGIADTGRERRTTWDYLNRFMQPYLDPIGLKIEVIPHTLSRVDLYAKDGATLMPAYTSEGRLSPFCSGEWKRDVFERWLRSKGVKTATSWIGYSMDELWRVKKDHRSWLNLEFPLIDLWINRAMIPGIVQAAGLPLPHKSRCWCCPHQTPEEWLEVQDDADEWAAAVALDHEIREKDPRQEELYLYSGRVPLEMANFAADIKRPWDKPGRPCESGSCWT